MGGIFSTYIEDEIYSDSEEEIDYPDQNSKKNVKTNVKPSGKFDKHLPGFSYRNNVTESKLITRKTCPKPEIYTVSLRTPEAAIVKSEVENELYKRKTHQRIDCADTKLLYLGSNANNEIMNDVRGKPSINSRLTKDNKDCCHAPLAQFEINSENAHQPEMCDNSDNTMKGIETTIPIDDEAENISEEKLFSLVTCSPLERKVNLLIASLYRKNYTESMLYARQIRDLARSQPLRQNVPVSQTYLTRPVSQFDVCKSYRQICGGDNTLFSIDNKTDINVCKSAPIQGIKLLNYIPDKSLVNRRRKLIPDNNNKPTTVMPGSKKADTPINVDIKKMSSPTRKPSITLNTKSWQDLRSSQRTSSELSGKSYIRTRWGGRKISKF